MHVEAAQDLGKRLARGREEELVDVDEGDPAGIGPMTPQAVFVGTSLSRDGWPIADLDDSRGDLGFEL